MKQIVFERLNTGGEKLSRQETRNAVYGGVFNDLCRELSNLQQFRALWNIPDELPEDEYSDDLWDCEDATNNERIMVLKTGVNLLKRIEDVELVLRFFAYRKIGEWKKGLNGIADFLDMFLAIGNKFLQEDLEIYRTMFTNTIDFVFRLLGEDAFTKLDGKNHRPNKILYDPLMFVASSTEIVPLRDVLLQRREDVREALKILYREEKNLFSGRSTNAEFIPQRNAKVRDIFLSAAKKYNDV